MIAHFAPKDDECELIAINSGDKGWVMENWGGIIANKWGVLSPELTKELNKTYNAGE